MMWAVAIALCGCAGGPVPHGDMAVRPAERPECQVGAAKAGAPQGQIGSLDQQRCHPDDALRWSSERSDTIKPDFSGKRDE